MTAGSLERGLPPQPVKELILQAASTEGSRGIHPVVKVISQQLPRIELVNAAFPQRADITECDRYVNANYSFLADAFVEAGPYRVDPFSLIQIWSLTDRVLPYARYRIAGAVASAYAVQGLDDPVWKNFPRHYFEYDADTEEPLTPELLADKAGLVHVQRRLEHVTASLSGIRRLTSRVHAEIHQESKIGTRGFAGSEKKERELQAAFQQKAGNLTDLVDNFGNGFDPLRGEINDALEV